MNEWLIRNDPGSFTQSPMNNVLQLGNEEVTWKERLKAYCKPTYQLRKLRNKGAIVVLIHNCLYLLCTLTYQDINQMVI